MLLGVVVELVFLLEETNFESTRIDLSPSLFFSPVNPPPETDSLFKSPDMPAVAGVKLSVTLGIIWNEPDEDADGGRDKAGMLTAASLFDRSEFREPADSSAGGVFDERRKGYEEMGCSQTGRNTKCCLTADRLRREGQEKCKAFIILIIWAFKNLTRRRITVSSETS